MGKTCSIIIVCAVLYMQHTGVLSGFFPGIDLVLLFQKLWRGWGSFFLCNHSCEKGCRAAMDLILGFAILNHT